MKLNLYFIEAVSDLLYYLAHQHEVDFFQGEPLRSLSTLAYSQNLELQKSVSLTFAEITEKDVRQCGREVFHPLFCLLQINDPEVQRSAAAALGNLAVNAKNKSTIVELGGLELLIKLMNSNNVEVQCNVVGCLTNLASIEENKNKLANSGSLYQLIKLAKSKDLRVQRNASGALLNMTHTLNNRSQLVKCGAIPVLIQLLTSPDVDIQNYCATALTNLCVDVSSREQLQTERNLIQNLIKLIDSSAIKIQTQSVLCLRNLASDENFQAKIVEKGALPKLLPLLDGKVLNITLATVACVRNLSIHPKNEQPIEGFLVPLINLLSHSSDEIVCHSISAIRNLAASEMNKKEIIKCGLIEKLKILLEKCCVDIEELEKSSVASNNAVLPYLSYAVQSEMTACLAVLALNEVQGNSAAVLGNLATRHIIGDEFFLSNFEKFVQYLKNLLDSLDPVLQHVSLWTILQFLEGSVN
ncbi:Vacuolar protein 8 [Clydaea vesicula]|uniref:Vacuolar protein 8 n=1 Tax=Clydaea vesicula TaxID=447962 RepID=A0AAD5TXW8_9FUNG|nr:Vacuolar protein 8 [Clydaea vesicula]